MTLIARINIDGVPIYIGDLLLSSERKPDSEIHIPAAADINKFIPSSKGRFVAGLTPKLNILNRRLIIGWAGSPAQARSLMRDVRALEGGNQFNWPGVLELIGQLPEQERNEVSLVGTILTPDDPPKAGLHYDHFAFQAEKHLLSGGAIEIRCAGTGAKTLLDTLSQITRPIKWARSDDLENRFFTAEKVAMALQGTLIGHETISGQNLLEWWGGGIEVATLRGQRFEKVGNTLHTFWRVLPNDRSGNNLFLIMRFIKYDYHEDILVIQTFDGSINPHNCELKIDSHNYHLYTPMLKSRDDYDLRNFTLPNFNHNTLNCMVTFGDEYFCRVHHSGTGDSPFRLAADNHSLRISFRGDLLIDLERAIQQHTKKETKFVGFVNR